MKKYICADSGRCKLFWIDEQGAVLREYLCDGVCFDFWPLPDGNMLYAHYGRGSDGVSIINDRDEVIFRYETKGEVFGCQPLANGNIVVAECGAKRLCEVNPQGEIVRTIPIPYDGIIAHDAIRTVRADGDTLLIVQPGIQKIRRYSLDGTLLKEYDIRHDAFGVLPRSDHLFYTCMEGVFELDASGNEVWSLTDSDVPDINIRWMLGISECADGHLLLTNWMGHGHRAEGIPFLEVDYRKNIIWSLDTNSYMKEACHIRAL